jgi:hypothetical protein
MDNVETVLTPLFPNQVNLFGSTRLEQMAPTGKAFAARFLVRIRFTGAAHGELRVWCDLDLYRLKNEEKAQAQGILTEAANIFAGLSLSELADRLNGHVMLAPPKLEEKQGSVPLSGTDYRLHLLDGFCNCRIEIVTKE